MRVNQSQKPPAGVTTAPNGAVAVHNVKPESRKPTPPREK